MRLIDADALLEKESIKEVTVGARHSGKTVFVACKTYLHFAIEAAPTIDAVPVIRCKDCIVSYCHSDDDFVCGRSGVNVDPDDFCSYGEKRDEEDRRDAK